VGSLVGVGRRGVGGLLSVAVLSVVVVAAEPLSVAVARAQLPGYVGVDPAVTEALRADALAAANGLLEAGEPGGEQGVAPEPVDGGQDVSVGRVPQLEVLADSAGAPASDLPGVTSVPAVDVPVGFVEGESEVVTGTSSSLTYQNPDGSFTKEIFPGPSVFRDEDGEWTQFDPQPVADGDRLEVPGAKVDTSFAAEGDAERLVEVRSGWRSVGFALEGAADVDAVPTETGVRYPGILPGVDLLEHAVFQGVKEELVLAARPATPPVFRFRLSSTGLVPRVGEAGSVELVDSSGRVVFVIPEGTAWDSNTAQPEELNRVPVETRLVRDGGSWVVELVPDWSWMSDLARVYPVVVDPQLVLTGSPTVNRDGWVWYQNPNVLYEGTTGTYSQWSSSWNAYVSRIGYTRVSGVWHQYRTYMYFAMSLPADTQVITAATLEADVIWVRDYKTDGTVVAPSGYASQIGMWRVTSPWSPAKPGNPSLTWNVQPASDPGYQLVNASQSGNLSTNVLSWVQGWHSNPGSNNGVMFAGLGYSLPGQNHGFTVLKALESDVPPVLRVTYVRPPQPTLPLDGAHQHLASNQSVAFSWTEPDNALTGFVQVCTDAAFSLNCTQSSSGSGAASISAALLPQNTTLYWRVRKPYGGGYHDSATRTLVLENHSPAPLAPTAEIGEGGFFETPTPTITVPAATDDDAGDPLQYRFKVCTEPNEGGDCEESNFLASPTWTASSALPWAQTYFWKITVWDGLLNGMVYTEGLESASPNEDLGASQWTFGTFPAGAPSGNVELASGNLTFGAMDVDPVSVGVDIGASRTYNSRDDRVAGLFGQGWTHPADMWVEIDTAGNGLVHLADGRTQFHGKSGSTFDDAWGSTGALTAAGGGYEFTLPSGVTYRFQDRNGSPASAELASIFDPSVTVAPAVTTTFTWTATTLTVRDEASSRSLIYTLEQSPSLNMHAVSVVPSGAPGEVWTYLYSGDRLMNACSPDVDPESPVHTLCTEYRYGPDNLGPKITSVWSPQTTTGTALDPNVSPTNKKVLFTVSYDGYGQVGSQSNGEGDTWTYDYESIDQPVAAPLGDTPTGIAKYKVTTTTPRGGDTTYYFDATRRLLFQQGATGAQQWWQYDERGFLTKTTTRIAAGATEASFATTAYVNDDLGRMESRTDPNGAVWQWEYNSKGRVKKEIDPYGFTTDTAYASDGTHVQSVTRRAAPTESTALLPVGHGDATTSYTYTDASTQAYGAAPGVHPPLWLLASVTDELGQETKFSYDQGGDLRWSCAGNATRGYMYTRFTYDAVGRKLTTETSTDDTNWTVTEDNAYDAAGRVISTDGPLAVNAVTGEPHRVRVSTVYDDAGNPLSVTKSDVGGGSSPDPARTTTYHYDHAQRLDRVTDGLGNTTDRVYDPDGNLEATKDSRGTRVEYTYDLAGRELTTTVKNFVDDPIGAPTVTRDVLLSTKTYDVAGRLETETDALGRVTTTTYDPAGMGWPVKVTLTFDSYTNILAATQYDLVGRMEEAWRYGTPGAPGQPDSFLQHSMTAYDLWGRAATVTTYDDASNGAGGGTVNRVETTTYDKSGGVLTTTTTGGTDTSQTRQTYLENGWLETSIVENGDDDLITMYDYDEYGRIKSITDPSGNVTIHTYDVAGRSVSTTLPTEDVVTVDRETGTTSTASSAASTTLGYNTFGEVTHSENAIGLVTVTGYDLLGRREQITHPSYTPPGGSPVVPTETFHYDANGNLESSVNRIGSTTTFTYDMMNRVVQRSDPAAGAAPAGVTRYTYDDAGNVLSTTDPIGAAVETTYDEMNLPKSTTQMVRRSGGVVDSFTSTVERDLAGRPWRTCSPQVNGETPCATAVYSPFGQLLRQVDPLGEATVYDYDGLGRSKSVTDPAGHRVTTSYDQAGRVASVSNYGTNGAMVDTTVYTRNQAGLVTHVDLPGGGQFTYGYDDRYRMTSVQQLKAATPAPEWITVSYDYDNLDRLVSTVDGRGNQWLTTYNSLGLEQDQIEPSTPGQTAIADRRYTSHYNAGGLLVRLDQPGGVQVQYAYDELARLTLESAAITASTPAAAASFGYDAAGRMTSFSAPGGDVALTYDDRGLLLSVSGPNTPSSFEYDALGRMTSRTDATGESSYQWDTDGRLVADTDPLTNTTRTYGWNDWDRVESVSYSAGGMQRVYTYDTAGRLATDTLTGDGVEQRRTVYGYDSAGRLETETISGVSTVVGQGLNSYGYDEAGRLRSWTNPAAQVTAYSWDDAGNRTGEGGVTSVYDARNRLTGSSNGDTFAWSARGTLVSQSVSGVSSDFVFDGLGRMVTVDGLGYQYDGLGRVAARSDGNAGWVGFAYSGVGLQPVSDGNGESPRT
jgi:YD repeat-containing protein